MDDIKNNMGEVIEKEDNKPKEKFAWEEGGLYSKIPKNKKSLKAINIIAVILGIGLIGLFVAFVISAI